MQVESFDFELPEHLIAQTPLKERETSRLMVLDKTTGDVKHEVFSNILNYLKENDTLVLNNTKVMPARLIGEKQDTQATIEVLLLKQEEQDTWETLVKPAKRVKLGTVVEFGNGILRAECVALGDMGKRVFKFSYDGIFYEILDQLGEMPLPPYITEKLDDKDRYQTVFAKEIGSAAAPTAGLHFTTEILKEIEARGIKVAYITLHVGLGTFRPVSVDSVEEHDMHAEFYQMSEETAQILNQTKASGGRIITVGTTSTRTLETIARDHDGHFVACEGWTDIFIYPPYQFKAIDGMLTNFHLPKSTLIMLISALAGQEAVMNAYRMAVEEQYRFFSFGDAMLIVNN